MKTLIIVVVAVAITSLAFGNLIWWAHNKINKLEGIDE